MWLWTADSPLNRRSRALIEANIVNLSKVTTNLTEVLRHLEAQEVLDLFDLSLIKSCRTNSQRCIKLYEIILQKNSSSKFQIFKKTLLKTQNNSLILDIMGFSTQEDEKLINSHFEHALNQKQRSAGFKEQEHSAGSSIIGLLVIGFTTSVPVGLFLYMVKTYYDQLNTSNY